MNESTKSTALSITPDTKVASLLKAYPHLEEILIRMTPAFAKLQNPILRNTVAKIASLRQAAQIGKIPLGTLINELRRQAGQDTMENLPESIDGASAVPLWFDEGKISQTLDAIPIVESGGHPLNQVMDELSHLKSGSIYKLITPFIPAPLHEIIRQKGFEIYLLEEKENLIISYFYKS